MVYHNLICAIINLSKRQLERERMKNMIIFKCTYIKMITADVAENNRSIELRVIDGRFKRYDTTRQTKIYSSAANFQLTTKAVNQHLRR